MKDKKIIFKTISILLPFVVLIIIELILRWSGYGYDTSLFIEDKTGKYYMLNPDISKKYFTIEENATIGNFEFFRKDKQENTIRIFVLGASSSIGFPYMHNGAFPRMLKYRLQFLYPETDFEIINLSLTAVNSYTLYDFSRQLVNYQPDAVLIYAGHNEYVGALGVASTGQLGNSPKWVNTLISMKDIKLVQWITRLSAKVHGTDKRLTDYNLTLMERMTANQSVPYDSEKFKQGIHQFEYNLDRLLQQFEKHNIPVFLGTLVSNQKDQKPFVSRSGGFDADAEYRSGNQAYQKEDYTNAKEHFINAKEYDELRFRAPEAINDVIRKRIRETNQIYLADVLDKFEKHSSHAILDSTLLLEHVHPNLTGQLLISETFYEALNKQQGLLPTVKSEFCLEPVAYPFTAFDTIFGEISILLLKELWPFNEPLPEEDPTRSKTFEEQVAGACAVKQIDWYGAMEQLYNYYDKKGDKDNALLVMEGMCLDSPVNDTYFYQAGKLSLQTGEDLKALFYFSKANQLKPSADVASNIAIALLKMDMPEKALPYIERIIGDTNNRVNFAPMKKIVEEIITLKDQLSVNPDDVSIREEIAIRYRHIGNDKAALKYSGSPV